MKEILEIVKELTPEQQEIFQKVYLATLPLYIKDFELKLGLARTYKIEFEKAQDIARFFPMEVEELERRLEAYKEAGYLDLIIKNPGRICLDHETILNRIALCKKYGKEEIDDDLIGLIFDDERWNAQAENLLKANKDEIISDPIIPFESIKIEPRFGLDSDVVEAINYEGPLYLDKELYDKRIRIEETLNKVLAALGANYIRDGIVLPISASELATRLLIINPKLTEEDIVSYCLENCYGVKDEGKKLANAYTELMFDDDDEFGDLADFGRASKKRGK